MSFDGHSHLFLVIGYISIYALTNISVVPNSKIKVSLILVILVGGSLEVSHYGSDLHSLDWLNHIAIQYLPRLSCLVLVELNLNPR